MKVDAEGPTLAEKGGQPAPAPAKSTLGKYRLDRIIGEGGMGVVWAGYDPDLERSVAIKVLRDAGDTTLRTRLLREARAMARLKHPNVLTVYEVGTDTNRDFIAMDLVDGGDLAAWLKTKPSRKDILAALVGAGRGLAAAHDAGLVHRDFKPHNVLRGSDERVYVTDFGLARGQLEPEVDVELVPVRGYAVGSGSNPRPIDSVLDSELTQTGVLIGTPAYMAPEQYAGKAPDPRTDQFAFCVTAWEALAGKRPFQGDSLDALRNAVGGGVDSAVADLPSSVRSVLRRGLDPDPAKRWPDMRALLAALERATAPRSRNLIIGITVGVIVLFAGGGMVLDAIQSRRDAPFPPLPPTPPSRAGGPCQPADQEFAPAWSPTMSAKLSRTKKGSVAISAVLGEVRAEWIKAYNRICALPPSAQSHEQISCLLQVRDELAESTRELFGDSADDDDKSLGQFAMVVATIRTCTTGP